MNGPFNKLKILCRARVGLEKTFCLKYSNTHLRIRETLPLNYNRAKQKKKPNNILRERQNLEENVNWRSISEESRLRSRRERVEKCPNAHSTWTGAINGENMARITSLLPGNADENEKSTWSHHHSGFWFDSTLYKIKRFLTTAWCSGLVRLLLVDRLESRDAWFEPRQLLTNSHHVVVKLKKFELLWSQRSEDESRGRGLKLETFKQRFFFFFHSLNSFVFIWTFHLEFLNIHFLLVLCTCTLKQLC